MTTLRSLTNVRSYYFRKAIAERDYEQREFGGRSLDDYCLDDFRPIWRNAKTEALIWQRRATTLWRAA
jgi:hypothetical protein